MGFEQGAIFGGTGLEPGLEARFVDEVDDARFLAGVGDEEGCEVGHVGGSRDASSVSQSGVKLTKLTPSRALSTGPRRSASSTRSSRWNSSVPSASSGSIPSSSQPGGWMTGGG